MGDHMHWGTLCIGWTLCIGGPYALGDPMPWGTLCLGGPYALGDPMPWGTNRKQPWCRRGAEMAHALAVLLGWSPPALSFASALGSYAACPNT